MKKNAWLANPKNACSVGNRWLRNLESFHDAIPMDNIVERLSRAGLVVLAEDGAPWTGILCGSQGEVWFEIGLAETEAFGTYQALPNMFLCLQWWPMQSGRVEVNAYLS